MTTLYVKRGRRYYPAAEHEEIDSYPQGAHLVICEPGSTLRQFGINPDEAALLAAAEPLRKEIARIVSDSMAMRPSRRLMTDRQLAAWSNLVNAMGKDGYIIEYASVQETADAVVRMLIDRAKEATA